MRKMIRSEGNSAVLCNHVEVGFRLFNGGSNRQKWIAECAQCGKVFDDPKFDECSEVKVPENDCNADLINCEQQSKKRKTASDNQCATTSQVVSQLECESYEANRWGEKDDGSNYHHQLKKRKADSGNQCATTSQVVSQLEFQSCEFNGCGEIDDVSEVQNKRKKRRDCCVINCNSNNETHELFTFPSCELKVKGKMIQSEENIKRIQKWIEYTANEEIAKLPIRSLHGKFFLCSDHFNETEYMSHTQKRKLLKRTSVPNVVHEKFPHQDNENEVFLSDGTECNFERQENDEFEESNKKKKRKRQCCVTECNNSSDGYQMFSIPASKVRVKGELIETEESLIRIQQWVEFARNEELTKVPLSNLHKRFFICSAHFDDEQFKPQKGKRKILRTNSVPKIIHGKNIIKECENEEDNDISSPGITTHVLNNATNTTHCSDDNMRCLDDVGNVDEGNMRLFAVNERVRKTCCAPNCNRNNTMSTMFSFPKVVNMKNGKKFVNDDIMKTYREWILQIGNRKLLEMDPSTVHKKYSLCDDHFDDSSFANSNYRNRLQKDVIPTKFLSLPLDEENMMLYDGNILKWKLKNDFEEMNFSTLQYCATAFEDDMEGLKFYTCENCKETHFTSSAGDAKCCHNNNCWEFSSINNMDPGDIPDALKGLTFIEEKLIARVHPMISVFKLNGLQYGYRGNVINFSQDVSKFANELPYNINDLNSVITVTYKDSKNVHHDFRVRVRKVRQALLWLKQNNPYYKNVTISEENLNQLPTDGNIIDSLKNISVDEPSEEEMETNENEETNEQLYQSGVTMTSFPHQDEQIKKTVEWPELGTKLDEFNTPGYIVCAFPTLFPYGIADLNDDRVKKVQKSAYFRHLLRYHDKRFATHATFRFFAYNSCMRWNALTDGSIFVRNNSEFKNMTVPKLAELIKEKPHIMKKIMFQASNLKGTRAYWHTRANELRDMVDQIGLPTFFLTLSSADGHWDGLYKLLSGEDDTSKLTEGERRKLIQENPHIVDEYFDFRVKSFIANVLTKKYNVTDYWYRIEYQHRGSPHLHGIFWVEGAPDVSNIENESEEGIEKILDYYSELVTAVNPDPDAEIPDIHPCRKSYSNVENFQEDLAQILNKVQRHTRCSTDYCLKFNKEKGGLKCRFNFPADMQETATFIKDDSGQMQFKPARNDPLLNKYNKFIIQLWRANIDICPVISKKALITYLAKYISKCEISSKGLDEILNSVLNNLNETDIARLAVQKLFMRFCGERDISAQEVCHSLLGLSLYSSGRRKFVTVNFKSEEWTEVANNDEDQSKYGKSFIEKYKDRPPTMNNVSIWEAATLFNTPRWGKAKVPNITRIFPRLKLNPQSESNEEYYKLLVLTHVPWRNEDELKGDNTWEELYKHYDVPSRVTNSANALGEETISVDDNEITFEDEDFHDEANEEWMILSRIGPHVALPSVDLGNRQEDLDYNWTESYSQYEQFGTIQDFENFLDDMKKDESCSNEDSVLSNVNLHKEQEDILNLIKVQIDLIKENSLSPTSIKRVIVQGKAGTGKSLLIKHIVHMLKKEFGNESYKLAAPTGVAAILINGRTVNSVFKLPKTSKNFKPLTGSHARNLCNDFKNVHYLILDEFSMIGSTTLGMIDSRCKEATGNHTEEFGGLHVIMFGDIQQLPPVKDYAVYSNNQYSTMGKHGKSIFKSFQKAFILQVCHRQQDQEFLNVLSNLSTGVFTSQDYELLSTRFSNNLSQSDILTFEDAIRLFSRQNEVHDYNLSKLSQCKDHTGAVTPVIKITAKHNCSNARKGSSDDAEGLQSALFLSKGCKIMLRKNLWVTKGLVNGAVGKVRDIIFDKSADSSKDMPKVILCEFDTYTGPGLIPNTNIIPIKPILKSWTVNSESCSRYQFPLTLAYACSIHKSQGMTLDKAVVDIGPNEFALGLSYVALSRVRSLCNLTISPFTYKRLSKLKDQPGMKLKVDLINYLSTKGL